MFSFVLPLPPFFFLFSIIIFVYVYIIFSHLRIIQMFKSIHLSSSSIHPYNFFSFSFLFFFFRLSFTSSIFSPFSIIKFVYIFFQLRFIQNSLSIHQSSTSVHPSLLSHVTSSTPFFIIHHSTSSIFLIALFLLFTYSHPSPSFGSLFAIVHLFNAISSSSVHPHPPSPSRSSTYSCNRDLNAVRHLWVRRHHLFKYPFTLFLQRPRRPPRPNPLPHPRRGRGMGGEETQCPGD